MEALALLDAVGIYWASSFPPEEEGGAAHLKENAMKRIAEIEKAHAGYMRTMQAALVVALEELRSFCAGYQKLPLCLRKAINYEGLEALLQAPLEGTEVRFSAEVSLTACRVKVGYARVDQGELKTVVQHFLESVTEAGIPRAERVLTVVEAIERRVAEARAYVASAAEDLEARLKAEFASSAYSALEARAALGGLKEA